MENEGYDEAYVEWRSTGDDATRDRVFIGYGKAGVLKGSNIRHV